MDHYPAKASSVKFVTLCYLGSRIMVHSTLILTSLGYLTRVNNDVALIVICPTLFYNLNAYKCYNGWAIHILILRARELDIL